MTSTSNAAPAESPYHGQDLKPGEIRLLTVLWTTSDEFELRTECHELTEDLDFDAISYVWGTAPASVPVKCNNATLYVTPTAFEMLGYLYLFKPGPHYPIWVDAICINQNNADEKAVQVPLMSHIYSRAYKVVVWMGQSTHESDYFLHEMRNLPVDLDSLTDFNYRLIRHHEEDSVFWEGMASLMSREWFKRLWTFQEIVLARLPVLLCGRAWLYMDHLLDFLHCCFSLRALRHLLAHTEFQNLDDIDVIRAYRKNARTIQADQVPDLLHRTRLRQVGEPVDRIWALYGLLDEDVQNALAHLIDYSENSRSHYWLTVISVVRVIVQMDGGLRLLRMPDSTEQRPPGLPSWCPDLGGSASRRDLIAGQWNQSTESYGYSYQKTFLSPEDQRSAQLRWIAVSNHGMRYVSASETSDILHLRGFVVGTIGKVIEDSSLTGAWNRGDVDISNDNPRHVRAIRWLCAGLDLFHQTFSEASRDNPDDITDFLAALWTDHRINEHAETAFWDALDVLQAGDVDRLLLLEPARRQKARDAMARLNAILGHSLISTVGGRVGLAPPGCMPGDKVCVFYGAEPLHVVRLQAGDDSAMLDSNDSFWESVGIAYIPHLMDQHMNDDARQGPDRIFSLA
jgi:hypothetical protein